MAARPGAVNGTLLWLQDELTQLAVAPALGSAVAGWWRLADGCPLLRSTAHPGPDTPLPRETEPRALAQFPLAPWSNRIAQGGYAAPHGWMPLAPNTPHDPYPIHGTAWQQPWDVVSHGSDRLCLRLRSTMPFAYTAHQEISLDGGCLDVMLRVTHEDAQPNWHGIGLHPYFPRTNATRLQAVANAVWVGPAGRLPDRRAPIPSGWAFSAAPRPLPGVTVDHAFDGWDGDVRIEQADRGYQLQGRSQGCGLFLLYCPQGQDFFCFEPVSHPVNAHHLPGQPGLARLQAGQSVALRWQLAYRPLLPDA